MGDTDGGVPGVTKNKSKSLNKDYKNQNNNKQ